MCHALLFLCDSQQLPRDSWTIAEYVSRMRSISISQESRRRTKTAVRLTQINKITGTVTTVGVIGKSRPRRQDRLFTLSTSWTEIACKCQCGPTRQPNSVQLSLFLDTPECQQWMRHRRSTNSSRSDRRSPDVGYRICEQSYNLDIANYNLIFTNVTDGRQNLQLAKFVLWHKFKRQWVNIQCVYVCYVFLLANLANRLSI